MESIFICMFDTVNTKFVHVYLPSLLLCNVLIHTPGILTKRN